MKTHKKTTRTKILGQETLIRPSTGEVIPSMIISEEEERDFNFHKLWLEHFIQSVDGITNKRLQLAFWIIENLNKENQLIMTQRKIAEKSGMSLSTVTETMKALQEGEIPFLKKINSGAYLVNPEIVFKGKFSSRMAIVYQFDQLPNKESEPDENEQSEPIDENQVTFEEFENEETA